jgi:hypothetical protein
MNYQHVCNTATSTSTDSRLYGQVDNFRVAVIRPRSALELPPSYKFQNLLRRPQASQIGLCADLDYLLHRHSVAPLLMNRVAVEIGEDRLGHSLNAAVLGDDCFVTDVVSRVLKLEGDLPRVSQILQHRE